MMICVKLGTSGFGVGEAVGVEVGGTGVRVGVMVAVNVGGGVKVDVLVGGWGDTVGVGAVHAASANTRQRIRLRLNFIGFILT